MAAEQTSIELIFEKQRELDAIKFIIWLTSNYDKIVAQHKMEIMGAYEIGQEDNENHGYLSTGSLDFYNEFYGD